MDACLAKATSTYPPSQGSIHLAAAIVDLASDTYNKSELRLIARESGRHIAKLNTLNGYQLGGHVDRTQEGHRLYNDHTLQDFKAELEDRGMEVLSNNSRSKATSISLLDRADDARTFHQFLELTPELRQRIYDYFFSYPDNAHYLQQPAISRTSQIVREESLPVFYGSNRFGLLIDRWYGVYGAGVRQHALETWPVFIPNQYTAMMRHFELTLLSEQTRVRVKIDLPSEDGKRGLNIKVWSLFPESCAKKSVLEDCQRSVETQMRPRVEALLRDPGLGHFTTREVLQLALAVQLPVMRGQREGVL